MNDELESRPACDPTLSRGQFIRMLVERAAVAGALVAIPAIADSFLAPPAVMALSGGQQATSLTHQNIIA